MSHEATADSHDGHASLTDNSTGIENKKLMMWLFLASDCMFFGTLISTHLIYRKIHPDMLIGDLALTATQLFSVELTTFSTFILLFSSFYMALAVSAAHKGEMPSFRRNVGVVIFFGLIFLGCQVYEFYEFVVIKGMTIQNSLFGTTFYVLTGIHGTHVAIGVLWLVGQLMYSWTGRMNHTHAIDIEAAGLYWHFVDIVWLIIFPAIYLVEFVQ